MDEQSKAYWESVVADILMWALIVFLLVSLGGSVGYLLHYWELW